MKLYIRLVYDEPRKEWRYAVTRGPKTITDSPSATDLLRRLLTVTTQQISIELNPHEVKALQKQ